MICHTLIALLMTNQIVPFANELTKAVQEQGEVVLENIHKEQVFAVKDHINGIPGIVVRLIVCDGVECEITVGRIYGG